MSGQQEYPGFEQHEGWVASSCSVSRIGLAPQTQIRISLSDPVVSGAVMKHVLVVGDKHPGARKHVGIHL